MFSVGGIVERIAKDSSVVWSIKYYGDTFAPHHDVLVLPNGNLMMPVWRAVTRDEAIALGRRADMVGDDGLWLDSVVELQVSGTDDYKVVWQWNSADHLVQDADPAKASYGELAENPRLIDINYSDGVPTTNPDIMHVNSVSYIPDLDQIIIDSLNYSELWVIDHSTTTAEAASHSGGRYGKGGDILYRWGNPSVYGKGDADVFNLSGRPRRQLGRGGPADRHVRQQQQEPRPKLRGRQRQAGGDRSAVVLRRDLPARFRRRLRSGAASARRRPRI